MLNEISALTKEHRDSDRLFKCCTKIHKFADSFEPYFEIINIFVQVKPDCAGIVWGSVRLIFAVRLNTRLVELIH